MFDFSTLTATSDPNSKCSFVGIKDDQLYLPKGCKAWAESLNEKSAVDKFTETQAAFLDLYRTLRVYRGARKEKKKLTGAHDSGQQAQGGQEILDENHKEGGQIIYYRHLDILDCILDVYDEQGILSLVQRIGRSERLDYSKIHKHLDRATFLEDDSFVVDEMMLPRQQLDFEPVEIVQMYCFTLLEIKKLLNENDSVPADIRVLAEQFAERHLASGDRLFQFSTWEHTRNILRERLEIIDNNTHYKDDAYHDFYDALERFLWGSSQQGQQGEQWGISAFHPVWESMCLGYLIKTQLSSIVACDTGSLTNASQIKLTKLQNKEGGLWTTEKLQKAFEKLRPDCVLETGLNNDSCHQKTGATLYRKKLEKLYGLSNLGDVNLGTSKVEKNLESYLTDLGAIDKGKLTNHEIGIKQRQAAMYLCDLLQGNKFHVSESTAFFIGRKLSAVAQPKGSFLGEEKSKKREVTRKLLGVDKEWLFREDYSGKAYIGSKFHINYLRGMIWEVYFSSREKQRDEGDLKYRKSLESYTLATKCIETHKANFPEINGLDDLIQSLEQPKAETKQNLLVNHAAMTIIDFKYLPIEYLLDSDNMGDIRDASVRKQFVYEYLLNEKINPKFKKEPNVSISSAFWIPDFKETDDIKLALKPDFLGGFIPLQPINVKALMVQYAET